MDVRYNSYKLNYRIGMESPVERFKALQSQLRELLRGDQFDEQLVQKRMTRYIALMVEDRPDEQERMFDHFCEFGGVEVLGRVMRGDPLLAVKCYSLLFINLRNEMWTSFILCQPFLMEAISLQAHSHDEEYTQYFVSFLKSLSIRINQSQVTLFYNKRNCTFPLAMAAMHYHNHPDFMVRTSVMNIVLELMKIQEPKTQLYFSRFPFTSYLVAFACEVSRLVAAHYAKLSGPALPAKQLTSYKVDLADYLYYFNDLVHSATPATTHLIEQIVAAYFIVPTFKRLRREDPRERMHALLLLHEGLRVIKSRTVLETIALLLFKPHISRKTLQRVEECEQVLVPEVFRKEFDPTGSYWGEYEKELMEHCLQVFKDVEKFEVSFEHEPKGEGNGAKFREEVGSISRFIGYDLLAGKVLGSRLREEVQGENSDAVDNPFKVILLQLLSSSLPREHTVATTLLLNLTHNTNISNRVLQTCQLRVDRDYPLEVNLEESPKSKAEFSSPLLQEVKKALMGTIRQIAWEETRVGTLSNTLKLLEMLVVESEDIQFQEDLLRNYREVTGRLREYVRPENMQLIVENFALREAAARSRRASNPCELSLPYPPFFLQQERWDQPYEEYLLPAKAGERATHLIQHFFLFRSFVTGYFGKFYEAEYSNFEQEYTNTFLSTGKRWLRGEYYRISGRTLNSCLLETPEKRSKKAMIVEDQFCFVLGELSEKGCRILVNEPWKNMGFEISRQQGTWLEVTVGKGKAIERYKLIFEDQVRSATTLVRLNDIKWDCCQAELAFIAKFLKAAAEE